MRVSLILLVSFFGFSRINQANPIQNNFKGSLHVEGRKLVNANGIEVKLRGVNVGGWLVPETWMCGMFSLSPDQRHVELLLEERFGKKKSNELMETWYAHWLTPSDLDLVVDAGLNMIRVPFGYLNLQDTKGRWKKTATGKIDFHWMDWIVQQAAERSLYVVFDFHSWRGQHEDYDFISSAEAVQQQTWAAEIWTQVARHYKGVPTIAAFDLINEPHPSPNQMLQRKMMKAVRDEDPARIVAPEWADPDQFVAHGFTNAIYSVHWYDGDPEQNQLDYINSSGLQQLDAPIWVGEWQSPDIHFTLKEALNWNQAHWNWTTWALKGVNVSDWALLNYKEFSVDISHASFDEILKAWSTQLKWSPISNNWDYNTELGTALKTAAAAN